MPMKAGTKTAVLVCILALAAVGGAITRRLRTWPAGAARRAQRVSVSGTLERPLDRALATGTPLAIEQDLIWRPATPDDHAAHSIVSHGEPFTGDEPTLRDFFERIRPIATQALASGSREQWPLITLNLDFKDSHPQHFAAIWKLLGEYEAWLTTAPRVGIGRACRAARRSVPCSC